MLLDLHITIIAPKILLYVPSNVIFKITSIFERYQNIFEETMPSVSKKIFGLIESVKTVAYKLSRLAQSVTFMWPWGWFRA